ncbi:Diamine acetyltransferase 2 OS=Bos taurus GN=SAT2 PE=2 SV=1 [Rhizoctonia solani AG-1 IB]|uniref:Diamine acetyltransferase 2 n=1 Tax=Thanatephorus cucumeris (strain AG1-IB / isolate 7/3/14) TaxID=1108050 RepID=A0A0B7FKM8_THACB|nr:Diamine acetyltransferase 2 OS=Bos taurus GN=SAT2 PE=2 SV=1 [Rhizoctonia solani AG-1 IB]
MYTTSICLKVHSSPWHNQAEYEKEPDSAKATEELLIRNIFEKHHASALVACLGTPETPGETVGLALYFFNFSTWTGKPGLYLEDLYVAPEHRNLGVGKALFGHLGKVAEENDCPRLDWAVLKWNAPSIAFYEQVLGAKPMDEWKGMRLETEGIRNLRKYVK